MAATITCWKSSKVYISRGVFMQFIMTLCVLLSIYTRIHMYTVASYVHVVRSTLLMYF